MRGEHVSSRAYQRALADLRDAHANEFERLYQARRIEEGLHPISDHVVEIDTRDLRRRWLAGEPRWSIAADYGCHPRTISNRAVELGLPRRKSRGQGGAQVAS